MNGAKKGIIEKKNKRYVSLSYKNEYNDLYMTINDNKIASSLIFHTPN